MPRKKKEDTTPLSLRELGTKYGGVLNVGSADDFQYERISFGIPSFIDIACIPLNDTRFAPACKL